MQELFWTPAETIRWIRQVSTKYGLWLVLWKVGGDARVVDAADLRPELFSSSEEDTVQIFMGSDALSTVPAWRWASGQRVLDFSRSYSVQFVPSLLTPDGRTLLQGRLAILRADQYEDQERAMQLSALFRSLQRSAQGSSDANRVVVQRLSKGSRRVWARMLIGREVPRHLQLKQFADGEVVFRIEPKEAHQPRTND